MFRLFSACEREFDSQLAFIHELVAAESPSGDVPALDACAEIIVRHLTKAGARVDRRLGANSVGGHSAAHIVATWPGGGPPVLLMTHFDTVWPRGQIARQPLVARDGKLFGPGVFDMKAGLAIAVTAARILTSVEEEAHRPALTFLATTDEEVGSGTSRALIEELARRSEAVLVFEPALPDGRVKTARKGVGEFELTATGIASHAGVDPGAGASAIDEIARQIVGLRSLAEPARGLTLNVGVVEGGTRSNVVAESARAVIDVRVSELADAAGIDAAIRSLRAHDSRVTLKVTGGINRPPMERTTGVARLFEMAQQVAKELGWPLAEGSTGRGSDGNFSAALGVPTLDGLGAVGDGAHALHEHIVIKDVVPRTALAAGLLARLGHNGLRDPQ